MNAENAHPILNALPESSEARLLAGHDKWLAALKKKNWRLRAGHKAVVDTKSYKVSCLPTIEVAQPPKRKYLPLAMPDGRWYFGSDQERDAVLKVLLAS